MIRDHCSNTLLLTMGTKVIVEARRYATVGTETVVGTHFGE
jgi:hypothetical protein